MHALTGNDAAAALWDVPPPIDRVTLTDGFKDWTRGNDRELADDRRFRSCLFVWFLERFWGLLVERYRRRVEGEGLQAANLSLLAAVDVVGGGAWRAASSDEDLRTWAARRAREAARIAARAGIAAYLWCAEFVTRHGVEPEKISKTRTEAGAVARMCCPLWWRRRVRVTHARRVERAAIGLGLVHARRGLYASDEAVHRRREQRSRNRAMLESCLAVNELGQSYTLAALSDLSVSNPVIRRGELMVRMSGFEQVARRLGHVGVFYTLTCPSRMHARHSGDGSENEAFDGTTPREAQQYLCAQWAKARAALHRQGIAVYGFRVAEPHHDGTPHWHMLLFMAPEHVEPVREVLSRYALEFDGDEPGADKYRFKAVDIDYGRGTATGYVAKYVSKNIDAFGVDDVDEDLTGKRDPKECARRVDAWAACWGIRQFQQIGGPPVTVWRELRRIDGAPDEVIEAARLHADAGNWCGYVEAQGGPGVPRDMRPVQLAKAWSDKAGRYGEPIGEVVMGVEHGSVVVVSRVHSWTVTRGVSDKGGGSSLFRPWSPVNNCTGGGYANEGDGVENGRIECAAAAVAAEGSGGRGVDRAGGRHSGGYGGGNSGAAREGEPLGGRAQWPMKP